MASPELPRDWEMLTMLMRRLGPGEPSGTRAGRSGAGDSRPGHRAGTEARGRGYTTRGPFPATERREERMSRGSGLSRPQAGVRLASGRHRVEDRASERG